MACSSRESLGRRGGGMHPELPRCFPRFPKPWKGKGAE